MNETVEIIKEARKAYMQEVQPTWQGCLFFAM